jgi:prepilin-type processing-associated H-X9-DG protein
MDPRTTPTQLDLKRDEKLTIAWADGHVSVYPIQYLRKRCPCAACKALAEEAAKRPKTSLAVIAKPVDGPIVATGAELVGGYAIRIDWSDQHNSGIYSFAYLREISPA